MDIELSYLTSGEGDILVLLHGNGENLHYFDSQIEYFSKYYKVIAIDTRGHGNSPLGEKEMSIRQFSHDLYDFFIENDIKKANILGFSDGGNIAIDFAINHSEMVDRLILNGANMYPSGVKAKYQVPIIIGYYVTKFLSPFSKKARENNRFLKLMVKEPFYNEDMISSIAIKSLVIVGDNDMIKDSHSRLLASLLPYGKIEVVKGSHFIAKENDKEFNNIVYDFLLENE